MDESKMVDAVRNKLLDLFDTARTQRHTYYQEHPERRPTPADVPGIIKRAARVNAAISGGLTLIPGPFGWFTVVPELLVIVRNQVAMTYDIGVAYGKEGILDRDLLLGVSLAGSGAGLVGFIQTDETGSIVKRPTVRIAQKLSGILARTLVKRLLRVFFGHWVPVVGAVAVAVATRQLTLSMGREAKEIFSKEIRFAPEDGGEHTTTLVDDHPGRIRVALLSDLANVDGKPGKDERSIVERVGRASGVEAEFVLELLDRDGAVLVDTTALDDTERDAVIHQLVDVALADKTLTKGEEAFIVRVASALGRRDLLDVELKKARSSAA